MSLINIPEIEIFAIELPLKDELYQNMLVHLSNEQKSFGIKRKHEYLAGRYCAKKVLLQLGVNPKEAFLPTLPSRAPLWPKGVCGSISHSKTLALAVASTSHLSLGIDIELYIAKDRFDKINDRFLTTDEKHLVVSDTLKRGTIIFSAKEALFKLINPLCETYFGFYDAKVLWIEETSFEIQLKSKLETVAPYNGCYLGKIFDFPGGVGTFLSLKK